MYGGERGGVRGKGIGEERKREVLFPFRRVGTSWSAGLQLVPLWMLIYQSTKQQVTDWSAALQGVLLGVLNDRME